MAISKNILVLALLLLLAVAISAAPANSKRAGQTKPPTTRTTKAPKIRPSRTKPPSKQKPIKQKPRKPDRTKPPSVQFKKCTAKYCDNQLKKIEKAIDDGNLRCDNTTCRNIVRYRTAFATLNRNAYTPKPKWKDEFCWAEYCKRQLKRITTPFSKALGDCTATLCPGIFQLRSAFSAQGGTPPVAKLSVDSPPTVKGFLGCSTVIDQNNVLGTIEPENEQGMPNLKFGDCLSYCGELGASYMVLAAASKCLCYHYEPTVIEDGEDKGGYHTKPADCANPCLGDSEMLSYGCGSYFDNSVATYSLQYPNAV